MKEEIRQSILAAGAVAAGFAKAETVDPDFTSSYGKWIEAGNLAGMEYLRRHAPLKNNPACVMEDAATVISVAFSYAPPIWRDPGLPQIACYAYGRDYHDVIRTRLSPVTGTLQEKFGGNWRICIDSAPLPERYWAMRCGIGRIGRNGSVIVDNSGSYIFLAEVLTSIQIEPDDPSVAVCMGCGACTRECPQGALADDGTIDARRCINYLTIEHRGDWTGIEKEAMQTAAARHSLYGCDICQRVCPHNIGITPTAIDEFIPSEKILRITPEDISGMDLPEFSSTFKGYAIKRAKLDGLKRNAANIIRGDSSE